MAAILILCLASGFAGLVYEVVWLRQLALLFGSTAYATSAALSIFFFGMAVGSSLASRRAANVENPLAAYAYIELGIALSAALYFVVSPSYLAVAPSLYELFGAATGAMPVAKLLIAATILFLPAALMGASIPMLAQHVVRERQAFARDSSLLYAANTFGGACGALAAAFLLTPLLGVQRTYFVAMATSAAAGVSAYLLARTTGAPPQTVALSARESSTQSTDVDRTLGSHVTTSMIVAFASGMLALSLEVVWTRMFAQVLQNSVYSYAAVLGVFLIALALGAFGSNRLARSSLHSWRAMRTMLVCCAVSVAFTPALFQWFTGGLDYLARDSGWSAYVATVLGVVVAVMLIPGLLVGMVFPYSLKIAEPSVRAAGETLGRLAALNMVGAIVGSLVTGFVLIPVLGNWTMLLLIAVTYALGAAALSIARDGLRSGGVLMPLAAAVFAATLVSPERLPRVWLDTDRGDRLLSVDEGPYGTVSVVGRRDARVIKLDNFYTVGGNASLANDRRQANLPLLIARRPRSAFFLGLGTGVTAGAAMGHELEEVTICELIPEIEDAARAHFAEYASGLFDDPRVRVLSADGREYLATHGERYDVVISDLFIPWAAGTGALYAREHYATVLRRLNEGGIFAQWLPLFQVSSTEFEIIARTMLDVFPLVTLWRGDFLAGGGIVALIGHATPEPLDPDALVEQTRRLPRMSGVPADVARALSLMFYAGNVTLSASDFEAAPINTYDHPHIEYTAPLTHREQAAGRTSWLVDEHLLALYERLLATTPTDSDPYLGRLSDEDRSYIRAGLQLQRAFIYRRLGERDLAATNLAGFRENVPRAVYRMMQSQLPDL